MISLAALFVIFAAVLGSAAMTAILAYIFHRIRQIEGRSGAAGSSLLTDRIDVLRDEMLSVQDEIAALSERLEFNEKLLMKGPVPDENPQAAEDSHVGGDSDEPG